MSAGREGSESRHARPGRKPAPRRAPAPAELEPGVATRVLAAKLLGAVVDAHASLDGLLDPAGGQPGFRRLPPRDQGLVRAILHAALRRRGTLARAIAERLERPLAPNARALDHLLHVGAAQILLLDVPDSAAVDTAVSAARADPRTQRFAALVNAVLRRLAREKDAILGRAAAEPALDCPAWLLDRLSAQYGRTSAAAIAAILRVPAPLDLTPVGAAGAGLAERIPEAIRLPGGTLRLVGYEGSVPELPGFADGAFIVQDAAASLPGRLFGPVEGLRVADLCAAPGGKTAQLAAAGARVTAVDRSASRMRRLEENLARLRLTAETRIGEFDGLDLGPPFDAVLLDAPCSSTGTLRRHPDVAYTKGPEEIEKLAGVQLRLLGEAGSRVAPGGLLVFSNCSLDREEGEAVVARFLESRPDFRLDPVSPAELPGLEAAVTAEGMVRTRPDMLPAETAAASGLDGFFAARLRRAD